MLHLAGADGSVWHVRKHQEHFREGGFLLWICELREKRGGHERVKLEVLLNSKRRPPISWISQEAPDNLEAHPAKGLKRGRVPGVRAAVLGLQVQRNFLLRPIAASELWIKRIPALPVEGGLVQRVRGAQDDGVHVVRSQTILAC